MLMLANTNLLKLLQLLQRGLGVIEHTRKRKKQTYALLIKQIEEISHHLICLEHLSVLFCFFFFRQGGPSYRDLMLTLKSPR